MIKGETNQIGKSTAAVMLQNSFPLNITITKFSKYSTESVKSLIGIDFSKLSPTAKESFRPTYIKYAEACKEIFSEDIWAVKTLSEIEEEWTIIDDFRFDIEYDTAIAMGFKVITIEIVKEHKELTTDYQVVNDSDLKSLDYFVNKTAKEIWMNK